MAVARQRMRAEQRREQLLDATRQLVDAEGFAAVTIEAVAQRCGVTRTLVYQQFGSLAGLLVAMVDREYLHAAAGFLAAIRRAPAPGETPFTAALSGVLDAVDAAPATWRMFLMPSEGGPARRLLLAVNHSGDSDSTGAICGNLVGAMCGAEALPARWRADVEVAKGIEALAEACADEFGPTPPVDATGYPTRRR